MLAVFFGENPVRWPSELSGLTGPCAWFYQDRIVPHQVERKHILTTLKQTRWVILRPSGCSNAV